jgi:hypothetical protein
MKYGGGRRRGCCLVNWKSGEVFAEELVGFLEDLLERFQRNLNRQRVASESWLYLSLFAINVLKLNMQCEEATGP